MVIQIKDFVEVCTEKFTGFGEVRWMGIVPEVSRVEAMVGVVILQFQEKEGSTTDGVAHGKRYFNSPAGKGIFAFRQQITKLSKYPLHGLKMLAEILLPPPINVQDLVSALKWRKRKGSVAGIVGHQNSSFMDTILFCMFAFRNDYDPLICNRLASPNKNNLQAQRHLRTIVRKMRADLSVPWQDIMALRQVMETDDTSKTWSTHEMDPANLVDELFADILKQPRFLEMSTVLENGQDILVGESGSYLIIDSEGPPDRPIAWKVPPLQDLFDATIANFDTFLDQIPKHLLVIIPGSEYERHHVIFPSFDLDITNFLRAHPKQCGLCGTCALYQCKACYLKFGNNLNTTYFCRNCHAECHEGLKVHHPFRRVVTNHGYQANFPCRVVMELCALLCRDGGHHLAYGKACQSAEFRHFHLGKWFFYDGITQKPGKDNIEPCDMMERLITEPSLVRLEVLQAANHAKTSALPGHKGYILQDTYIAFYHNPRFLFF